MQYNFYKMINKHSKGILIDKKPGLILKKAQILS